jgi:ATP-dependent DNA helicase RecQ
MKGAYPIRINRERQPNLPGGRWEHLDPVSKGRVQIVSVQDAVHQAQYIKNEIDRLRKLDPKIDWTHIAVLSRTKAPLAAVRAVLEAAAYPVRTIFSKGLPLHRVREIRMTLDWMEAREKKNARASDLKKGIDAMRAGQAPNPWWALIGMFFESYGDETMDSTLPVSRAVDRLYEFVAEQRREKVIGNGIFLSTIHSAKGMEFAHVFVLDGDWSLPMDKSQWEEERRIMYTAMTRAEQTLCLLKISKKANPFLKEIRGEFSTPLTYREHLETDGRTHRRYELLGLDEIYLDYASRFPQTHPIHKHLGALQAGQRVSFHRINSKLEIHDGERRCLAQLSNEGFNKWIKMLEQIIEVRVLALLKRNRDDPDESFLKWIQADEWELPLLEVIYRP